MFIFMITKPQIVLSNTLTFKVTLSIYKVVTTFIFKIPTFQKSVKPIFEILLNRKEH
jgi:fatty acid-binding protein DegV